MDSHADVNSEEPDADEDMNDYVDGVSLEALTSDYSVKSPLQKAAQLSVDWMQGDVELGLANPERRCLNRSFLIMFRIGKATRRARMLWCWSLQRKKRA